MRLKMMLSEAVRSIRANLSTTVAATMTVLIGMFLLGLVIAFATYARSWSDDVKADLVVKVFHDQDATPQQVNAVRVLLEQDPRVDKERIEFISAEEGLRQMRRQRPDIFSQRPPVQPARPGLDGQHPGGQERGGDRGCCRHRDESESLPGRRPQRDVRKEKAKRILRVANIINAIFGIAVLVLLSAAAILIANTIRLSIFARRREIEVMGSSGPPTGSCVARSCSRA